MPVNINGVWRDVWSSSTRINGVWRDADSWVRIDGVWRKSFNNEWDADTILGFRLIYVRSETMKHPDFPNLKNNSNIPIIVSLAGKTAGSMDLEPKSMVFEYLRESPYEEGIAMYVGTLYAVTTFGILIDVAGSSGGAVAEDRRNNVPFSGAETWSSNKFRDVKIDMYGYALHEGYEYYTAGWNDFFTTERCIDPSDYPSVSAHKKLDLKNPLGILPAGNRDETYSPVALIGIARDVTSPDRNMVRSRGVLDQTVEKILVNDVPKPFVIEYYG